ncbi:uncharacterized protein LOC127005682 [Eriocheir sinensis]|uniref:uncharacterized protein LOC127005682 n=1 Tax=Eriocheir sinensis TaxID=95602 RepID=UPI0021C6B6D5|nr:uncharacterized protein LOC127005682 [Eriocheir sinensis]XP_050730734.1 uncharacterized protein LOC127005682 [Eriocheir sinensis]
MASTSSGWKQGGGDDPANHIRIKRKKKRSVVRGSYSLEDKAKILMLIERGWKNCEIQKATGVPESTLRSIKKRKEDLKKSIELAKKYYSDNSSASTTLMNELTDRRRLISTTEHMLVTWAQKRLKEKGTLDSCMLRNQALLFFHSLSKRHGIKVSPPFNASYGWLARFKKRIGMGEGLGHSVGTKPEQPPATPTHRPPTTVFHEFKEEPPSPPSEDPLAILPEEEAILRSVGGSKVTTPQVVIPLDGQSLVSPPAIADQNVWVINEEYAPHSSDSEATLSANPFNSNSDDEHENDFVGFEDERIEMETKEEDGGGMSTKAAPPLPPQHQKATTPPPPPQNKTTTPDIPPRTPNSSSAPNEITRPQPPPRTSTPPHTESNKNRAPTLRRVRINRNSTSPARHTSPNKDETAISQHTTFSDKGTSMPQNTPSLPSYIQPNRKRTLTPHAQSSEKRASTHHTRSSQDRTSTHHKQSIENGTSTPHHTRSTKDRTSTHHTYPTENRTCTAHHTHSTQDTASTHHTPPNENRTSTPHHTRSTKDRTSTHHTPPTENRTSTPHRTRSTKDRTSTHHTYPTENRTCTAHHTHSTQDTASTHHTYPTENRTCTAHHTHSTLDTASTHHTPPNEKRTSTPHHTRSTKDRTSTHHTPPNEKRTSTPHHTRSTKDRTSTHHTPPTENRTSTPHRTRSTKDRTSTHLTYPTENRTCTAHHTCSTQDTASTHHTYPNENRTSTALHTHSTQGRSSTQHTPSPKVPQTPTPMCIEYEDKSPQQQHRTPTSQLTRPVEVTQTGAVGSELSCMPSVGQRQQQALCLELQGRQTEEANVHTRLAEVTLDNEMIKREILKEALLQKRLETAVQRQRALQSGVELSQLSDEPSKCNDDSSKPSDEPAQPCGELTQARDAPSQPSNGTTPKHSKKVRRLLEKVKLLDKCREGMSNGAVARLFNLTKSTVRYTKKHEARIRRSLAACTPPSANQVVQARSSTVSQLENAVYVWINDQNMKRNSIDDNDICAKAKSLYEKMTVPGAVGLAAPSTSAAPSPAPATHPEFRATKRWLLSFRRRFSVRNIKTSGQSASADHVAAAAFLRELESLIEEKGYRPEQVWNMDETVLYWKRMPARTLLSKGRRVARDRCALLLCANAAGHLTKPGLVYTSANPGPLRQKKKNLLPVHWMTHSQGCTTSTVVMDWARHCLLPEVQAYLWGQGLPRKFLLILDNALGHHQALEGMLEGVEVVFLPPNTSPLIQPLEQGIMAAFKACYTRRSMQRLQESVDVEPNLSVADYWSGFTIADCLVLLQETLRDLRPKTVNDCWSVLWPECAQDSEELTAQEQVAEAVRKTVELARLVGGEGFADMEQGEVRELLEEHSAALTDEELLEMVQPSQEEAEEDTDGSPQRPALTLDKLGEAMRLAARLNKYVCDMDPSMLRALMVVDNINQAVAPYKKVFEDMKRKQRQSHELIKIASASPPQSPSLTSPEPKCVVKVDEQPAPVPASQPDHDTSSSSSPGSDDDMDYTTPADEDTSTEDEELDDL